MLKQAKTDPSRRLSFSRKLFEPAFREKDLYIHDMLPYAVAVNDNTLSTIDGELLATVLVEGHPSDTSSESDLDNYSNTFTQIINQIDGNAAVYVNKIIAHRRLENEIMNGNDFASVVDQRWSDSFDLLPSLQRYSLVTFGVRPSLFEKLTSKVTGEAKDFNERERLVEILNRITAEFVQSFAKAGARRLSLSTGELLGYLASIQTAEYHPIAFEEQFGRPVGYLMTREDYTFGLNKFRITKSNGTQEFGAVFSLKNYPRETEPGMYDGLDISHRLVVTHSFLPLTDEAAKQKTGIIARQMEAVNSAAKSQMGELEYLLDDIESKRVKLGNHHSTVSIFAESEDELRDLITTLDQHGKINGGVLVRENIGLRSAYFSQFPGNQSFKVRNGVITSKHFADMTAFHARPKGKLDGVPWGKPVTYFRSIHDDIYPFNFHRGQESKEELTRGHSLVVGGSGSGKTLTTLFLAAQAKRFGTRIFAFDKDQGMEVGLRALGCNYTQVKFGKPTGLNPFASEIDDQGVAWLSQFVQDLFSQGHEQLNSEQRQTITRAVQQNAAAFDNGSEDLCNFKDFSTHFSASEDGGDLKIRADEWVNGSFSWMFDGKGFDPLSDPSASVGFDVTQLFDNQRVRTAWLNYVLRRIERLCDDGQPTMIIMDEAWIMLDDPKFAETIGDWFRTMRKKNCVVVMMSQQPKDFSNCASADAILSNVATKFLFLDPDNNPADYQLLDLTETEAEVLKPTVKHRQVLCVTDGESILLDVDLSALGGALDVLGGSGKIKRQLERGWQTNSSFWKDFI